MAPAVSIKSAPCQQACPAGVDVPRYVRHIRDGRFAAALAVVRERIPFPLVCGHACFHPCEARCGRSQFDAPVAIRLLKRVAAELGSVPSTAPTTVVESGKRVAVIGSGPCGLTAADCLARQGHDITVFEALPRSGGLLRFGIPAYRLPDSVVDADIRLIEQGGVKIRTGTRVASAQALLADGFDAVLVATGAWRSARLGIPGERGPQVSDGLGFLSRVNSGEAPDLGARVVVIGGGSTAIDAARVSRRFGADVVQLYRRTRAEMPAAADEVEAALEEGVRIEYLHAPLRIEAGGVSCVRMALGEADASGRPRPLPLPGSEYTVPASSVIVAIGQEVTLPADAPAQGPGGRAAVDRETLATSTPGIFAAGDAVLGPASIIEAIAQGRRAAAAIDRFLGGEADFESPRRQSTAAVQPPAAAARGTGRPPRQSLPLAQRLYGFAAVERSWDARTARQEAMRCLSCDLRHYDVEVDTLVCKDCGYCREACRQGVFARSHQFNPSGYLPAVAAHPQRCVGCLDCLFICPDFAITINERCDSQDALGRA